VLTLNGSNSAYAGVITVSQGILKAGNVSALGTVAGGTIITNSGTLDVNGQSFNNAEPVTVSGAGAGGNGAIINTGTNQTKVLRLVALAGDTTFGGPDDWDIHSSQTGNAVNGDALLTTGGNVFKLTKAGTNTVTLFGVQVDAGVSNIDVMGGTLSAERNTASIGDPNGTVAVFTNGTFQLNQLSNTLSKLVLLKDGGTLKSASTNAFNGTVTLESGLGTVSVVSGAGLTLNNNVGGAGGLAKSGSNTLFLTSASYTGSTLVGAARSR
jgi:fibronectin-binding autotransporter adhesin